MKGIQSLFLLPADSIQSIAIYSNVQMLTATN